MTSADTPKPGRLDAKRRALIAAARRVMRLSRPGTLNRFFTLWEVEKETGLSSVHLVNTMIALERLDRRKNKPSEEIANAD